MRKLKYTEYRWGNLSEIYVIYTVSGSRLFLKILLNYLQGGQNLFEQIRTKIRTFSEEIRTIRTIFEKNPYNPYNLKKIRTIRTFF